MESFQKGGALLKGAGENLKRVELFKKGDMSLFRSASLPCGNTLSNSDMIILIPFTPKYVHDKHCKPHQLFMNVTMKLTISPGGPAFPGGPSLP